MRGACASFFVGMKRVGAEIYNTHAWKRVRQEYAKTVGGLCERCLSHGEIQPGEIVHHKIHLTEQNKHDPNIAFSFDNLELLCRKCHAAEHPELMRHKRRYFINSDGSIAPVCD